MKRQALTVYTSITLTMIFWALSYIWIKIVYYAYRPLTAMFFRALISGILLWLIAHWTKKLQPIQRKDFKLLLLMTIMHPFLYFLCESFSLTMVSSTVAAVMVSTIPLLVPIGAYYILKERISILNIIGLVVSFIGVVLLITREDFSLSASPQGLLLLLGAVVIGVGFTIILKKLSGRYNAITLVTYQNLFGIIWFAPFFLFFDLHHFLLARPSFNTVLSLVMLAVFASSLAFILFTYAVRELGASRTSVFGNSVSVFTALFAWLLLGDPLTLRIAVGIVVVIMGLFISQVRTTGKNLIKSCV